MIPIIEGSAQHMNLIIPAISVIVTGALSTIGSIFGNKKLNELNRKNYELIADKKFEAYCNTATSSLNLKLQEVVDNQNDMSKKIDFNTRITSGYSQSKTLKEEFDTIKIEALNYCKEKPKLSELLIAKADSLKEYFFNISEMNVDSLSSSMMKSTMQVRMIKTKQAWIDILKEDIAFIEYYYDTVQYKYIDSFFIDVCWLLNPQRKINNIDVEGELKLNYIRFFRHSIESLLSAWDSYCLSVVSEKC